MAFFFCISKGLATIKEADTWQKNQELNRDKSNTKKQIKERYNGKTEGEGGKTYNQRTKIAIYKQW